MPLDPAADSAFATLLERWTSDHLGWDEDEGIGILWKEGGYTELLAELYRRAPLTTLRLAGSYGAADATATSKERGLLAFVQVVRVTDPALRRRAWDEMDLPPPQGDLQSAIDSLDPPMASKYVRRIEAWIDLAQGIEVRCHQGDPLQSNAEASLLGCTVVHPKFGSGVVRALEPGANEIASVDFDAHGLKRIATRFLKRV